MITEAHQPLVDASGERASIAPVPNQRYYDTIYQDRYMGLPSDNEEGYRLGSPITIGNQLKGELLLIHGTGDDNCHYQTSELLINDLKYASALYGWNAAKWFEHLNLNAFANESGTCTSRTHALANIDI